MNREKSLMKNTLIITIGKICTQLITFLLLPIYTGILSTEEYGTIDLLNTLVALLLPLITFQAEQGIFRELIGARNNKADQKDIISSGIISVSVQCIVFIALFTLISPFIHNNYKTLLLLNVITSIFNSLFLQITRGLGQNNKYAIASFISAITTIIFNILFLLVIKLRVNGMLIGTMIGQITSIIYLLFALKIYKYLSIFSFYPKTVKKLWTYSLPLIPNAISWWIFNSSDRVIVSTLIGLSSTGLLSAANKFPSVYITMYNMFNMSWTESVSLHVNDKDISSYFNKTFNTILNLFTSLSILIIAIMPFVFPIMINSKFNDGYGLIPILMLASIFNVIVGLLGALYAANKNTKAIANTAIISAIINIVSHLLLINFIGLYAAAISTFLSYFIMAFYRLIDVGEKYFPVKLNKKATIKTLIILAIILPTYYINNIFLNIISLILAILFAWNLNKNSIQTILKFIKTKFQKKTHIKPSQQDNSVNIQKESSLTNFYSVKRKDFHLPN